MSLQGIGAHDWHASDVQQWIFQDKLNGYTPCFPDL
jgi:hypothetical protein